MAAQDELRWLGWLGALALVLVLLSCAACGVWVWAGSQTAIEYEIPAAYRGWVVITYQTPGCPPLRRRGFTWVITLDAAGRACTSSEPERGPHRPHYLLVGADGSRVEIPRAQPAKGGVQTWRHGSTSEPQTKRLQGHFYVGTEAEAQRASPFAPTR